MGWVTEIGLIGTLRVAFLAFFLLPGATFAQEGISRFDQFEILENELVWRNTYVCPGDIDSVRHRVVQMLKSKFFTFNVIRNEAGYNGELHHYKVDCKKYDRNYMNTPRMYWDGEWTGKFIVVLNKGSYQVSVYALYYEKMGQSSGYYRTEKPIKGRYLDAVTSKNKLSFRKNELANLSLMGASLRDDFDVKNTTPLR